MGDTTKAKVRIKVGSIEIEYEGNHEFLNEGLSGLLENVSGLVNSADLEEVSTPEVAASESPGEAPTLTGNLALSTNSIATHYSAKSTSDLALCAIIQLQLIGKQQSCSRDEILQAMKSATNFYTKNMRGTNLKSALKTLSNKKKINELAEEKYALTAQEKQNAETELASIG